MHEAGVTGSYEKVGSTFNTDYYIADLDILIVSPQKGLRDDAASAKVNVSYQLDYARKVGRPCAVVVMMSALASQDAAARKVYATDMDPALCYGAALVVSNPLSRAIGSFFLGLSKPRIATRMFDSIESAIAWARAARPGAAG